MQNQTVALFGQAQAGAFHQLYLINTLTQLSDIFGHPPENSAGIPLAIQLLHYQKQVLFVRVNEEGFSLKDYYVGLKLIEDDQSISNLAGIALPGVGDAQVVQESLDICQKKACLLLTSESDMYDYFTS